MVCLFSSQEYPQFWGFGGTCVSRVTSHCRCVGFCIALCVVSALNSWASQSMASVSAEKCKGLPFFFLKPC